MGSEAIDRLIGRLVTKEEVRAALEAEIESVEREDVLALVKWFTTRYPTAEERLAYVRQAYARWQRHTPD
jgi:hypothetical protein